MRYSPTLASLLAAAAVFLVSPYVPTVVLNLLIGSYIGSTLVLLFNLYLVQVEPVIALAVMLASASLFLEYRKRVIRRIQYLVADGKGTPAPVKSLSKPAPNIKRGEIHPPHEEPVIDEHGFVPSEEIASNSAESLRQKAPLETVHPDSDSTGELMQELGFARL
jgi:hypothetical protein